MNDRPQQPLKWLLNELSAILSADQYTSLMTGYDRVKRRYDLASRLRVAQNDLALYRRNQGKYEPTSNRHRTYAAMIERRINRIKQLEQEISEL